MRVLGINNYITFKRRPTKEEERDLKQTVEHAYDYMGTSERVVITHGSCFPAGNRNSYIGSPYGNAAKDYIKFLSIYGFNGNQLGPVGELEKGIISPYNSSAFAKNRLFIDLEELASEKYGKILSKETLKNVTKLSRGNETNYDVTDFPEAEVSYNRALKESYNNFKANLSKGQPQAIALNKEFLKFVSKHDEQLTNEGIFKVLSKAYGSDDFQSWDKLDRNLIVELDKNNPKAIDRYLELLNDNKKEIEQYKFEQFVAVKQIKENKEWRDENGFKYFNDLLVGCSKMDYWRNQDAFLDGYQLGAPENSGKHQVWKIPVLNPRKLFIDSDMNLGSAGRFLKDKINFALEYCENLRVDHAMGLIEPFVIENDSIIFDEDGKVTNTPHNPVNGKYMSEMTSADGSKLDDYKNYSSDYVHSDGNVSYFSKVMDYIVIPILRENGLNEHDAVWEDICSQPKAFREVFYNNLNLPGLSQLEWDKLETAKNNNWFLVGSHDSIPAQEMIKQDWVKSSNAWNPLYLAGFLNQDGVRSEMRNEFCDRIAKDDKERVKAKFSELLLANKFQISFADLLGITDMTYNIGGSERKDNWKVRISPDYLDKYYENLASESPTALNIPEILRQSLQAKIDMDIANSDNPDIEREELYNEFQPVLDKLDYYAQILKEPEN